jgi:hypothetical protein
VIDGTKKSLRWPQETDDVESGDESDDEASEILSDIQEALSLARRQGVLPPVRIARILAGEGTGQFSSAGVAENRPRQRTVPLSVALDYVGAILDESRKEISRLKVSNFMGRISLPIWSTSNT